MLKYERLIRINIASEKQQKQAKAFKHTSEALRAFLFKVLQFNPLKRPSATELLRDPIFDKIRVPSLECVADTSRVDLPFDEDRPLPNDPFDCVFYLNHADKHSVAEIRAMIV